MIEYEYSFKVNSVKPYIEYCEKEEYVKVSETSQIRKLFINNSGVIARMTTIKNNNDIQTLLDFKDADDSDKILKSSRETIPLKITNENKSSIKSILNILNYKEEKHLERKRVVYKKDNVTFEIDEYSAPEVMYVVAIEGEKETVDKVYNIIKKITE